MSSSSKPILEANTGIKIYDTLSERLHASSCELQASSGMGRSLRFANLPSADPRKVTIDVCKVYDFMIGLPQ
eukprot:2827237-Karenia_brevis.AAC.1